MAVIVETCGSRAGGWQGDEWGCLADEVAEEALEAGVMERLLSAHVEQEYCTHLPGTSITRSLRVNGCCSSDSCLSIVELKGMAARIELRMGTMRVEERKQLRELRLGWKPLHPLAGSVLPMSLSLSPSHSALRFLTSVRS